MSNVSAGPHPCSHHSQPSTSDTPTMYYVLQLELDLLITEFSDGIDPLAPVIRGELRCAPCSAPVPNAAQRPFSA